MDCIEKVEEFHNLCRVATPEEISIELQDYEKELLKHTRTCLLNCYKAFARAHRLTNVDLRIKLIIEELNELVTALLNGDKIETLDALCDLEYVLNGAILSLGYSKIFSRAFAEVHRSNLAKTIDGAIIKDESGKILKPDNWEKPNLAQFIEKEQFYF